MTSNLRRMVPHRLTDRLPGRLTGREGRAAPVPEGLPTEPAVGEPILRLDGLTKHFPAGDGLLGNFSLSLDGSGGGGPVSIDREWVRAVDDVSLTLRRGETLALVGESGCGKTTLARTTLRLLEPTAGRVYFRGRDVTAMDARDLRSLRADVQIVFQDAGSSLDPRLRVGPIVEEPMAAHGMLDADGRATRARDLLAAVGLDPQHYDRFPHALSGGQRQRVAIARALSVEPDLLVLDEPVAALDATLQAQILDTLADLQAEFGLTYLCIAHDLSVVRHVSDRVAVMYLGHLVEVADCEEVFENPRHPYTEALLDSIPVPDPRARSERSRLPGEVPSPVDPPSGCRFHTRCPRLIAPPDLGLSEDSWDAVREFVRAVDRRAFGPGEVEDVRRETLAGVDLAGEAGDVVDAAAADVRTGDWEAAVDRLHETFVDPSICSRERPDYEVEPEHGDGHHFAACHLNRDE